jgi:hypothetical protein
MGLCAADPDEEEDAVMFPRILRPKKEPLDEIVDEPVAGEASGAKYTWGLVGGITSSGAAERAWKDAVTYGIYMRKVPSERKKTTFELAAGYSTHETEDGLLTSDVIVVRADLLFGSFGDSGGATAYLVAGGHVASETAKRLAIDETVEAVGGGASVGLGLGGKDGRWDLRGFYSFLFTDNTENDFTASFGFGF